jgi:hypothetical protein
LIEGERRWTSAKIEEIPAVVVGRMNDHDELVVMFQVHTQHRGWEVAEQLNAIRHEGQGAQSADQVPPVERLHGRWR